MLVVVGTPIGNLKDLSYRAVETLKNSDLILCEDTRTSQVLLKAYDIKAPLLSFHKFNEKKREEEVIEKLKAGLKVALISDAGMPGICDPGTKIIHRCREEGIETQVVPGPSALISALSLTGWEAPRFQFVGYLEKKEGELKKQLIDMLTYEGISISYETPHHLKKTLLLLQEIAPKKDIFLARELTKLYEECLSGTAEKLLSHFQKKEIKGELVLILRGEQPELTGDPKEWVTFLMQTFQLSQKEALLIAAKWLKCPKRKLYDDMHRNGA